MQYSVWRIDLYEDERLEIISRHCYHHWVNEIRPQSKCLPDDDELEEFERWQYETWGALKQPGLNPNFNGLVHARWMDFPSETAADTFFNFYRDKEWDYWAEKNNRVIDRSGLIQLYL